ncbi:molybdopterin-dependent oxidoreductase [Sulfurospirillum arcachonense]|uniref:molybdopterin-dependent oxidoreductase n=1 Tax=Sulfurospirillum arcachonense TaxID=57666 RepID=UPI0004ACAB5B|nr:molybdopterin-dependent oxidoreductase [Sulfurospirillum arcachonense]
MLTTCALDCFDGCSIEVDENLKLKGEKKHPITQGFLCHHMTNFHKFPRIEKATLHGKEISIDEAIKTVKDKLGKKTLFYKGSGNLGVMQGVTKLFFAQNGADLTQGSLCQGAGEAGIEEGRGACLSWSPKRVEQSDVVIIWGQNPSVTNSHVLPALKGKTVIVIDPYTTDIAKKADLHVKVKPRGDIYLAMQLSRMAYMAQMEDEEFIENRCENFDYFIDFVNAKPIVMLENRSGVCSLDVDKILSMIKGKKVSFLVGLGVQKYSFGHSVLRAIDSFAAMLGLFGKEGCGVSYIANSAFGFKSPFSVKANKVVLPLVDFGNYDLVFIQGGNPVTQSPCTPKVKEGLEKAKFVVYFGLHVNETSKMADLIIPAKTFLEKQDMKLSYGHEYIGFMPKIVENDIGISEYDLCSQLGCELKSEQEYIDEIFESNSVEKNGRYISKTYEDIPYEKEFYTDSGKFEFFDDFYDDFKEEDLNEGFYLLHAKYNKSLNSQFTTEQFLHVPVCLGLKDNQTIKLTNGTYECEYVVKNDENLRDDCMLLYSGHKDANMLTPYAKSDEGDAAIYQEMKCQIVSS